MHSMVWYWQGFYLDNFPPWSYVLASETGMAPIDRRKTCAYIDGMAMPPMKKCLPASLIILSDIPSALFLPSPVEQWNCIPATSHKLPPFPKKLSYCGVAHVIDVQDISVSSIAFPPLPPIVFLGILCCMWRHLVSLAAPGPLFVRCCVKILCESGISVCCDFLSEADQMMTLRNTSFESFCHASKHSIEPKHAKRHNVTAKAMMISECWSTPYQLRLTPRARNNQSERKVMWNKLATTCNNQRSSEYHAPSNML